MSASSCHGVDADRLAVVAYCRRYNAQAYNTDPGFARTCLLVFAVASPYVDDERVLFPKEDGTTYGIDSAGWIVGCPLALLPAFTNL